MLAVHRHFLIFAFILAFIVRSLFFIFIIIDGANYFRGSDDARQYNDIAVQISRGNGISISTSYPEFYAIFSGDKNNENSKIRPNFYRLPGYPIFIACFYKLFGENPQIPLWVQIIISSLIPILIFILALILFPKNIILAKISALVSVFYYGFVFYSCILMSESLFLFFMILFFICLLRNLNLFFCKKKRPANHLLFIAAGAFLGIASLLRAVGPMVLVVSLALILFSNFTKFEKLKSAGALTIGWLGVVFGWLLRNWLLTGYIFFHTLPGPHFFGYPAIRLGTKIYGCEYMQARKIMLQELNNKVEAFKIKTGKNPQEIDICNIANQYSKSIFLKTPFNFVKLSVYHILRTIFKPYPLEYPNFDLHHKKAGWQGMLWYWFLIFWIYFEYIIILGFMLFIPISFFRMNLFCILSKILPLIFVLIFITLAEGLARLRLPVMPFFIPIFAFVGWLLLKKIIGAKH